MQPCLSSVLPQVVSQGLASMNVPSQPQAQTQQLGLSVESVAAAVAAAIAAQKDKPKDPKEPPPWEEFLAPTATDATNAVALELSKLFKTPPNLQSLKLTAEFPQFRGIPVSAPARNHAQDMALYTVQEKLRVAMLCFINAEKEENNADRYVGAVFLRSAHQDLLQMRRKGAAGRKVHALEPRPDDPRKAPSLKRKRKR